MGFFASGPDGLVWILLGLRVFVVSAIAFFGGDWLDQARGVLSVFGVVGGVFWGHRYPGFVGWFFR